MHADAAESVLAHAWRETASDEACMHVVVVNIDVDFHAFELSLTGLTDAEVSTTAPSRISTRQEGTPSHGGAVAGQASLAVASGLFPLFDGSCSANPGPGFRPGPGNRHDIAAIWVAFFSRWQRYRRWQASQGRRKRRRNTNAGR